MPQAKDLQPAGPVMSWTLAGLALSILLPSLGTSIANIGLPTLMAAFGASFQAVQWVVLAYLLAITTLIVSVGRLGDLLGRRKLLLAGIAVFTVASALCGLAPALPLLIAARAVQGLGAATMMALAMACVGEALPRERTGSAMGVLGSMSAIGTALGPALGGALIAAAGWPAIFLINLPLGALAFVLVYRHLPASAASRRQEGTGFDVPGTLLLAVTLAAYALALTIGRGHFGYLSLALLAGATLGVALFLQVEAQAPFPLIRPGIFRDLPLSAGLAGSALVSTVLMATLVVGPFHLSRALGLNAAAVGLVISLGPLVAALTAAPAGRLVDRLGARPMSLLGLAGIGGACVLLAVLPTQLGVPAYLGPIMVLTASYALFQTANNTGVMAASAPAQRGLVSGMLNLSRNLGLITGTSALGAVFSAGGLHITFAVAAALIGLALALALLVRGPAGHAAPRGEAR
ncbi:MFS transporter [Zoogloea sp.]|uniref:MFS transporter n=1 Tax=Zoogloea sp. TaxID=49181 RepID=UPI001416BFD2|nr:MAG: MFS transporter [Zoogloea sp.]